MNHSEHVATLAKELVTTAVAADDVMRKQANPRTGVPPKFALKAAIEDVEAVLDRIREDYLT